MNETTKLQARVREYMTQHKETYRSMAPKLGFSTHAGLFQWMKKKHSVDLEIFNALVELQRSEDLEILNALVELQGPEVPDGCKGLE